MHKANMQVIPFVLRFSDLKDGPTQIVAEWSLLDLEIPLTQVFHLLPLRVSDALQRLCLMVLSHPTLHVVHPRMVSFFFITVV